MFNSDYVHKTGKYYEESDPMISTVMFFIVSNLHLIAISHNVCRDKSWFQLTISNKKENHESINMWVTGKNFASWLLLYILSIR